MTIYSRSEELVSRCVECDLAEPESLVSLGGYAPGLVDRILSITDKVVAAGRLVDVITMALVVDMFSVVAIKFAGSRNSQKKWHTIAQEIRRSP